MRTRYHSFLVVPLLALALPFAAGPAAHAQTTFTVTVVDKTPDHPYNGQGWPEGFVIDGDQGAELTLVRGETYAFQMSNVPAIHPFFITTSEEGGPGAPAWEDGVTGNDATGDQTLTFTVPMDAPDELWYQCHNHSFMGYRLNIVDPASADVQLVADGFTSPVVLAEPPDGSGRLFIADQIGVIRIVDADGTVLGEPFLDLRDEIVELMDGFDERGLLGLTFHPGYASNGRFFVYYSAPLRPEAPNDFNHTSHISEFTVSGDPNVANPASERLLLQVDEPQFNHNAGTLAFGPDDGYLYISLGDGGGGNDVGTGHVEDWYDFNEGGNGQDIEQNLLGSLLRIDVDGGDPYAIPEDNPFVGLEGVPAEQYAYGFRNPYRFSFDMGGEFGLLVGDAGQELYEEVSVVTAGANYGWNVKEGFHCFDAANPETPPEGCPDAVGAGHPLEGDPLIDPVIEFLNGKQEGGLGTVIIGGHVYRGSQIPDLDGRYIFGAFQRDPMADGGLTLVATPQEEGPWPFAPLEIANEGGLTDRFVLSYGQDLAGEVYMLTTQNTGPTGTTGEVWRLAPGGTVANEPTATASEALRLRLAGPNPVTERTAFTFDLRQATRATLTVYDVLGRRVTTLIDGMLGGGQHRVTWNPDAGPPLPAGIYIARLTAGDRRDTVKLTLVR